MAMTDEELAHMRAHNDIVAIIAPYVALRRAGQDLVGLCPFHGEKTPSFSVSPHKNLFYCFGCHVGGDCFAFLMRHLGLNFKEAAEHVAQSMGITLSQGPSSPPQDIELHRKLWELGGLLQQWFSSCLWGPLGGQARQVLQTRRIPEQVARRWHLGFAPAHQHIEAWLAQQGLQLEALGELGLLTERGQCLLHHRLIFPICDPQSHVIAFGGRVLGEDGSAKYLNSRNGPLFVKQHSLFAIERALPAWRAGRPALLVEGYFDVLACDRADLPGAVAPMGTTFSTEQANLLKRWCKQVLVLMDGDQAGQRSCLQICTTLLQANVQPLVSLLPNNHDPDSLLRQQGPAVLRHLVQGATPAMEHFVNQAFADKLQPMHVTIDKANSLAPLLLAMPRGLERDVYTHRIASALGLPSDQLLRTLQANLKSSKPPTEKIIKPETQSTHGTRLVTSEKKPSKIFAPDGDQQARTIWRWLKELLLYPHLRSRLTELLPLLSCVKSQAICRDLAQSEDPIEVVLQQHLPKELWQSHPPWQAPSPIGGTGNIAEKAERALRDTMHFLQRQHIDAELQTISQKIITGEVKGDATAPLLRRKRELILQRKALRSGAA